MDEGEGMVILDGQPMFRIAHTENMPPFLMNIVSESDRWMYVSSTGGLTAGRVDPDHSLFLYETEDRLHHTHGISGPFTILRVHDAEGKPHLWEPFSPVAGPSIRRNLYKNLLGNQVVFEEINDAVELTFRYRWSGSEEFGFIRTVTLERLESSRTPVDVEWIDGLLNILPSGLGLGLQQQFSSLSDAYKYSEIDAETDLGIFSLASLITDRAEPAEALKATVVWCRGLTPTAVLLSTEQLQAFRQGATPRSERLLKGRRGNYLVCSSARLQSGESSTWDIVADVDRDQVHIERLRAQLREQTRPASTPAPDLTTPGAKFQAAIAQDGGKIGDNAKKIYQTYMNDPEALRAMQQIVVATRQAGLRPKPAEPTPAPVTIDLQPAVAAAGESLERMVAGADGLQASADPAIVPHHFANVLFNIMRGGIFAHNYDVPGADFTDFVRQRNRPAFERHDIGAADSSATSDEVPSAIEHAELLRRLELLGDPDMLRLGYEYLPLTFSRRHGDPSRPWNRFNIHVKDEHGGQVLNYQGNWRDIFQNWEGLCLSYPEFIEGMLAKFVNASTVDGFNPYRVTRDGIEWEAPDPHSPWSNIGYWGDHQIIYLLKFLEASHRYHPGRIERFLHQAIFSYANVPYRIKPYQAILENARDTIVFDADLHRSIEQRTAAMGADGKLVLDAEGRVLHVNLAEKLLVTALARLANLVVDGGIWMNTQRPEWNDANNALVGGGISMVTLCYLRRYLAFCIDLFQPPVVKAASFDHSEVKAGNFDNEVEISSEIVGWLERTHTALLADHSLLNNATISDQERKRILDALGTAFDEYRQQVYAHRFSGKKPLKLADLADFFKLALEYVDHGIRANRRTDGLYHAYNLIEISSFDNDGEAKINRLYEMLEGQVAALSSGLIGAEETLTLLDAMFNSKLYRADQQSFMLYPDRELPGFLRKNIVPANQVETNPLLTELIAAGDRSILHKDARGQYRFSGRFRNAKDLQDALATLARNNRWTAAVAEHGPKTLATFESVFNHAEFTGRSGGMFGYEGLGCIYWHMVTKLLVAVQERFFQARREGRSIEQQRALAEAYYRVRQGLGFNKSAREYGAFPMDPYSHTPGHGGARQPGMTGQVKEEIITRWGELGVLVEAGQISFQPVLLRRREFLSAGQVCKFYNVEGEAETLTLPPDSLAFTFCQVPIVYHRQAGEERIDIETRSGSTTQRGDRLDPATSSLVFRRAGQIRRIDVTVPDSVLLLD
jgi:hypothetical protein